MRKLFLIALALLFVPMSAELMAANVSNLQEQNNQNTAAKSSRQDIGVVVESGSHTSRPVRPRLRAGRALARTSRAVNRSWRAGDSAKAWAAPVSTSARAQPESAGKSVTKQRTS